MFNFKLELLSVADICHGDVTRTLNPRPGKKNEFHKTHVVNTHVAKHTGMREHVMNGFSTDFPLEFD